MTVQTQTGATGPRTEEGKKRSSMNAMKHGMTGDAIRFAEETPSTFNEKVAEWSVGFPIKDSHDEWLVKSIAAESMRIDHCRKAIAALTEEHMARADYAWEPMARAAARELADKLGTKPELVAGRLRDTKYGCELLIKHWDGLLRVLRAKGDWNDAQKHLAMDLLGVDLRYREDYAMFRIGVPDADRELFAEREAFATAEIAAMREIMEGWAGRADASNREKSKAGAFQTEPKEITRYKRYERECTARRNRYHQELSMKHAAELKEVETPESEGESMDELVRNLPAGLQALLYASERWLGGDEPLPSDEEVLAAGIDLAEWHAAFPPKGETASNKSRR